VEALLIRARSFAKSKVYADAVAAMLEVVRLEPARPAHRLELAQMYSAQGDLEHAGEAAKKATEMAGGEEGYRVLASLAEKRRSIPDAVAAYKKWLVLSRSGDKESVRGKIEVLIRRSPPLRKVSHAPCKFVEDCPGLELCEDGLCQ